LGRSIVRRRPHPHRSAETTQIFSTMANPVSVE
jgi:hypothetical protein